MSHQVALDKYKVFNDCVHGHMNLHPLCVRIIDTSEFQRLRNLKQVGPVYFVYPGASHNRFEHSLGVCYLAGQMVDALRRNTPTAPRRSNPDIISDDEKLAVEVAALCHDLGHGPISHTWERFLHKAGKTDWKHEECSITMFRFLIEKNKLRSVIEKYLEKLNVEDFITLIEDLIKGDDKKEQAEKKFLFQIVSNKSNGIDVDRWDYFLRDGHQLNISFSFNYRRLLEFCQIINVKGNYVICFRKKEAQNIYDMFMARAKLHKKAYHHHAVEVIEEMIIDALYSANKAGFRIKGKLLSEAHENVEIFSELTDHVIYNILCSEEEAYGEARTLLHRILCRDLYSVVECRNFSHELAKATSEALCQSGDEVTRHIEEQEEKYKKSLQEDIHDALQTMKLLSEDKFTVKMIKLDLGSEMNGASGEAGKKINPFTNIFFYDKHTKGAKEIDWKEVPLFLIPEESVRRLDGLVIYKNKGHYEAEQEELRQLKQLLKSKWNSLECTDEACAGKFAAVRKCTHKETGIEYAAKFIRKRRRAMDQRQDILHEIAILKIAATSSRIVHLHEVYETSTEMALILEMAAGGELQRVVDLEEGLEEQQAVKMMRQILEGLCFLHDNNIAHLDLKPQNLLLTATYPDCDIKLCDFGISRVIQNGIEVREIIGTPDYVAPEILSYEPISLATDIWSVGILAYVLLSGYSPFGGDSKQETFCNISQCCLSFPDDLFDGVSSAAKDFIQMTLIKEPSNRLTVEQCLEHPWLSRVVEKPLQVCTRSQNKVKTPYIVSTTNDNDQLPAHKRPKNSSDDKRAYPVASCLSCSQCGSQCCQLHATQRQNHHSSISISPVEITVDRGIIC